MPKPLTERGIKALRPGAVAREVPAGIAPGLYFVLRPSGDHGWVYRYRSPETRRPAKMTIGRYPAFGIADARREAFAAYQKVARGLDPGVERKARRLQAAEQGDTIGALLDEFVARHVRTLRPSTAREMERIISNRIPKAWRTRKAHAITPRDVTGLLERVADGQGKPTPIAANRTLAVVRKFFNWCVARQVLLKSPAAGIKPPAEENSRDRTLTDAEMCAVWRATESLDPFSAIVRVLLLTGQRRGEVAGMRRSELVLDGDAPTWTIPKARTKNGRRKGALDHAVPLVPQVVALIRAMPEFVHCDYVFTNNGRTPVSGFSKAKRTLDGVMLAAAREMAEERGEDPAKVKLAPWRLHDLRRTMATGLQRAGVRLEVTEAVLNHSSGSKAGIVGVYQRYDYADERRAALMAWADRLEALTAGA